MLLLLRCQLALLQALHRLPKGNRYRDLSELSTVLLCYETSEQVTSEFVLLSKGCIALDFTPCSWTHTMDKLLPGTRVILCMEF